MADRQKAVTVIVGAGPAGLLTSLLCRLRWHAEPIQNAAWDIYLFDKRDEYARDHRLRIDPAPYLAIQRELGPSRFDELITFSKKPTSSRW